MFPKFIVIVTKHTPATPTSLAKSEVVEQRYAETAEDAQVLANQRSMAAYNNAIANGNASANQFGEGTPTWQAAVYEPTDTK